MADDRNGFATGRLDDSDDAEEREHEGVETDGGQTDGERSDGRDYTAALATYTDDEYGYSLAYPADWIVETDRNGGATFEAPHPSSAGAAVFVKENGPSAEASAAAFLGELDADVHVHALEVLSRQAVRLQSGQTGRSIECAYAGDSCKRWRLSYLFVRDEGTGYTVGVDWNDTADFDGTVAAILESFALGAT